MGMWRACYSNIHEFFFPILGRARLLAVRAQRVQYVLVAPCNALSLARAAEHANARDSSAVRQSGLVPSLVARAHPICGLLCSALAGDGQARVCVGLVLRGEVEIGGDRTEKHLGDLDPVRIERRGHECLEVIPASIERRSLLQMRRDPLQDAHWDISVDADVVGAPVLQPVTHESAQYLEPFGGRDVPVAALLHLCEDPRLDERAARQHHRRDARVGPQRRIEVLVAKAVAVTDEWQRRRLGALRDVAPVCQLGVALLA
eukprot:scaffold17636_cov120-Isochrysis_galbana.AAC.5